MKRLVIEQSDEEFYASHSGNALVGLGLNRFTSLSSSLAKFFSDDISHGEVIKNYSGLLSQVKSDFDAINQYREDDYFRKSLGNKQVPSEGTMRQRMDLHATTFLPAVSWASVEFLQKAKVPASPAMEASSAMIVGSHISAMVDCTRCVTLTICGNSNGPESRTAKSGPNI